jgi:hypothetical protein
VLLLQQQLLLLRRPQRQHLLQLLDRVTARSQVCGCLTDGGG